MEGARTRCGDPDRAFASDPGRAPLVPAGAKFPVDTEGRHPSKHEHRPANGLVSSRNDFCWTTDAEAGVVGTAAAASEQADPAAEPAVRPADAPSGAAESGSLKLSVSSTSSCMACAARAAPAPPTADCRRTYSRRLPAVACL